MKTKAVIYARYSSSTQSELSIEGQLQVCHEYAGHNGYEVVGTFIDRAISGTAAKNRPGFRQMLEDSADGGFEAVLVYQLDRFARNRFDSAMSKYLLRQNGVRVVSARETISGDASGILMEAVLEGMAEYYSCELSQKVRRGLTLNAQKGLYTGAGIPPGYKIRNKRFIVDTATAPTVRRVFSLYLANHSIAEIVRQIGKPYNKGSIRRILSNPRYTGLYKYSDTEIPGAIPRIIDDETFRQAQALLGRKRQKP